MSAQQIIKASPHGLAGVVLTSLLTVGIAQAQDTATTGGVHLAGGSREVPATHTVRTGETLWGITGRYFASPYEWPRVWSLNPAVTNPHWIYPEMILRLRDGASAPLAMPSSGPVRTDRLPAGSIIFPDMGFLDQDALRSSGRLVGSPIERMLLATYDPAYIRFDNWTGREDPTGEMVLFRPVLSRDRQANEQGSMIRIAGVIRIDSYDREHRLAHVTVTEALEPLERGLWVAPVQRTFHIVPTVPADRDLETEIIATLDSTVMTGQNQVVFVPVGEAEGLRMGNRLTISREGDAWSQNRFGLAEITGSNIEPPEPGELPSYLVAEARVVSLRPHTAGLLVTGTTLPLEVGDRARMRRGY